MHVLQTTAYCTSCRRRQVFVKLIPNYTVHALLTVATFGLWGVVWLTTALYNRFYLGWRCEQCSHRL